MMIKPMRKEEYKVLSILTGKFDYLVGRKKKSISQLLDYHSNSKFA